MSNKPEPTSESPCWLSSFQIFLTSRSDRLYNNGRQQIELTVLVVPGEGQTISDEQFDSISLAYEAAEGDWIDLPRDAGDGDESWFYQADHDERYDYYPSLLDMAVPVYTTSRSDDSRFIRLYVHSTAAVGESIKVRASISQAPGQVHWCAEPLHPKLYTERSPLYSFPEDYRWQRRVRCEDRLFESCPIQSDRFLVEYSLRPKHTAFSWASMSSAGLNQIMRWDEQEPTVDHATIVSAVLPDSADVVQSAHLQADTELTARMVTRPLSSTAGQIVLIAQGDPEVSRGLKSDAPHQPLMIKAYDRQGALHRLEVDFASEKNRTDLQVNVAPASYPIDTITNISYFKVLGRGLSRDDTRCLLYSNGMQQTYVRVLIEGVNNLGEVVPVPPQVLQSIRLVEYYTGESIGSDFTISLTQSEVDKRFIYYQDQPSALDPPSKKKQSQAIDFYIKAKTTKNVRVAAKLTIGEKTYHTYDRNLEAGEGATQSGRSNCSATIDPKVQNYWYDSNDHYTYDKADHSSSWPVDITYRYELRLKSETHHQLVYAPDWTYIWWSNGNAVYYTIWIHFFGLDERRTRNAETHGVSQFVNLPNDAACQTQMYIDRRWPEGSKEKPVSVKIFPRDENGNEHSIWIASTWYLWELLI
ncbi:hypothetical protein IAE35_11070 [Pseudomonas sp. S75]|uniref:hypothetical protein n=1 Tax=unclassified Pseudomonas TaxID=196821 RepID=UPI00190692CD|nr:MULTISPECIES: hypothetical protein [unclassified Pseudomonas]MBJ9976846.1 hypothetical protein [Pseudomonas sp. S30]MBK0153879.1 hypothetical protein [Pseudomonas sp. S75]